MMAMTQSPLKMQPLGEDTRPGDKVNASRPVGRRRRHRLPGPLSGRGKYAATAVGGSRQTPGLSHQRTFASEKGVSPRKSPRGVTWRSLRQTEASQSAHRRGVTAETRGAGKLRPQRAQCTPEAILSPFHKTTTSIIRRPADCRLHRELKPPRSREQLLKRDEMTPEPNILLIFHQTVSSPHRQASSGLHRWPQRPGPTAHIHPCTPNIAGRRRVTRHGTAGLNVPVCP